MRPCFRYLRQSRRTIDLIEALRCFTWIVEIGSFSAVARESPGDGGRTTAPAQRHTRESDGKPCSRWHDAHISNSAMSMHSRDITHKCGHTVLLVSVRDADHAQQLVQQDCPDCQRASLPPLQGSPRQVAWAEKIRAQAMDAWLNDRPWLDRRPEQMTREAAAGMVAKHGNVALLRQTVEIILECHARLHIERSAKWWIEHGRDSTNFAKSQLRWAEAVAAHLPPIVGVNV